MGFVVLEQFTAQNLQQVMASVKDDEGGFDQRKIENKCMCRWLNRDRQSDDRKNRMAELPKWTPSSSNFMGIMRWTGLPQYDFLSCPMDMRTGAVRFKSPSGRFAASCQFHRSRRSQYPKLLEKCKEVHRTHRTDITLPA